MFTSMYFTSKTDGGSYAASFTKHGKYETIVFDMLSHVLRHALYT